MLGSTIRAAPRAHVAARTAAAARTAVVAAHAAARRSAAALHSRRRFSRRSATTAARTSIVHDALVMTPAQRRRHIFNEALAMTPEARAGDGPHVTFLRALTRRLLDPTVLTPHGRVHVALDAEPDAAEELELVGADVGRVGWEYR